MEVNTMRYTVTIYDEVDTIIYQVANVWKDSVPDVVDGYLDLTQYQPMRAGWSLTVRPYDLGEEGEGE